MKHRVLTLLLSLVLLRSLPALVTFGGLDLSDDNRLLFRADAVQDGSVPQNALFVSRLTDLALSQMTAFPERMELIANGRIVQVRNAFGALRISLTGGLPQAVAGFPSFVNGKAITGGRVEDMAASQDGRWLLYVEPVSSAYGNLILVDTQLGEQKTVALNVERPDLQFPACWSPDSRVFVYACGGKLYYYTVNPAQTAAVDDRYRLIGDGTINSVSWSGTGDFFYLKGSTVFRVRGSELFARTLYADFLEIGAVLGKIPFDFDGNFDRFWIAPDSRSILFSKGGRNIFYYPLEMDDFNTMEASLPYVVIPQHSYDINVLWGPAGPLTVIASVMREEGPNVIVYRLSPQVDDSGGLSTAAADQRTGSARMAFIPLEAPPGSAGVLSPDGAKALFWGEKGVVLYDYINWRVLRTISSRPSFSCFWISNEEFVSGDDRRIERVQLSGFRSLVCLAGISEYGFEERGRGILAQTGGVWFATDGVQPWTEVSNPPRRSPSQISGRYRVYLEPQVSGPYENLPMIRNTAGVGTVALVQGLQYQREAPARDLPEVAGIFSHGLRSGLREVSLCFDLYDDITGLPQILDALRRFGFRATFFLNGEFIRRYPEAARIIARAGHESASMFFAPIDLSDSRFRIGGDFISRGLARNEDEFYRASQGELALLWHPPYYAGSTEIAEAAAQVGYRSSGRDVDPMDWVSREDARRLGISQYPAGDMIDQIMEAKRPGSIIPVRLGMLSGGRSDYLFLRINVLMDALVRSGYTVVPVSTLMEHAK
ncbi:MAG: polysaccharide deacetylase family protein [Treponema sp.]|jgi:peptidoglycan/xylan/chitin deacetylase (PgdA/CDA1 family)|nr:polysaccharide deacetylase family protein [Treponema sp.]